MTAELSIDRKKILSSKKLIDFNTLLTGFNIAVAIASIFQISHLGDAIYTNTRTIILGLLLAIQTHFALVLERRERNPLLIIVAFVNVFFYSLRIVTLNAYSISTALSRFSCQPDQVNYAILYIIAANMALYLGLIITPRRTTIQTIPGSWRAIRVNRLSSFLILSFVIMYGYNLDHFWLISIFRSFFSQHLVIGTALAYWLLFHHTLTHRAKIILPALMIVDAFLHLLEGSRGSVYILAICYMCAVLAIAGRLAWRRRHFAIIVATAILSTPITIAGFYAATYIRQLNAGSQITIRQSLGTAFNYVLTPIDFINVDEKLIPIFDRLGFFDYSVDLIVNSENYGAVVKFSTYIKSLVDNLFTPGFDVFDQPPIANSLRAIYEHRPAIRKSQVTENYQTDQLGIYGEAYVLFGYFSLVILFALGVFTKKIYNGIKARDPFTTVVWRYVILTIWFDLINSYGIDWIVIDSVELIVGIYFLKNLIYIRRGGRIEIDLAERVAMAECKGSYKPVAFDLKC